MALSFSWHSYTSSQKEGGNLRDGKENLEEFGRLIHTNTNGALKMMFKFRDDWVFYSGIYSEEFAREYGFAPRERELFRLQLKLIKKELNRRGIDECRPSDID